MKNVTLKHICSYKIGPTDYTGTTQCPGIGNLMIDRDNESNDWQGLAQETHPCKTQAVAGLSRLQEGVPNWATSVALPTEVVANLPHK